MTADCLVRVVVGKLGSGKTWYCVMQAMEALMRGDVVVSNVRFEWAAVESYCKRQGATVPRENYRFVDTEKLCENPNSLLDELTEGSMLLLDETHLILDSREWQANREKAGAFQTFLTQARKLKVDVWFISQSEANVDSRLVRMATYIVRVSNWLHMPVFGTLLPLPVTVARVCAPDGKTVYGKEWIWRRSNVGRLYNTRQTFKAIELTGRKAGKVRGQKKRVLGYGWILMMAGASMLVIDKVVFGSGKDETATASKPLAVTAPAPTAPVSAPAAAKPAGPQRLSQAEVNAFEASLPAIYRLTAWEVACENGLVIRPGVVLGLGTVKSWGVKSGYVAVSTDSVEMPVVRLYYRGRKPRLSFAGNAANWSGTGVDVRPVSEGISNVHRVDKGDALTEPAPAAGKVYEAPQAFIPPYSGPTITLGPRIDHVPVTPPPRKIPLWPAHAIGNVRP